MTTRRCCPAWALAAGGRLEFVFCDVSTFAGDLVRHLASYQVDLTPRG